MNWIKLLRCKEGIENAKALMNIKQRDESFVDFHKIKEHARKVFQEKYKENIKFLRKEMEGVQLDKSKQILLEKNIRNIRGYLSRVYFYDLLKEASLCGAKFEITRVRKHATQFIKVIPNFEKIFFLQKEKKEELEEKVYFDQKKLVAHMKYDLDKKMFDEDFKIEQVFYIHTEEEILKREFPQLNPKINFHLQNLFLSKLDDKLSKKVNNNKTIYKKMSGFVTKKTDVKDQAHLYLLKLKRKINQNPSSDYGKYLYLEENKYPIMKVAKYYRKLYQFLITNFQLVLLSLNKDESMILREMLIFHFRFDQISMEKEMDQIGQQGKNIASTLIVYDELKQKEIVENKQKEKEQKEQGVLLVDHAKEEQEKTYLKKKKVISDTIEGMVNYIENCLSLQENFQPLINNFKQIKDKCYKSRGNITLQELKYMIVQRCKYINKVLFISLYEQLLISHSMDKNYGRVYFQMYELLFMKNMKNKLNLKQFETQFVDSGPSLFQQTWNQIKNESFKKSNRFRKKVMKNKNNIPDLKMKLCFLNSGLDFDQYIFNLSKQDQAKSHHSQSHLLFSDLFSCKKLIKNNFSPLNPQTKIFSQLIVYNSQLDDMERGGIISMYKKIDKQCGIYNQMHDNSDMKQKFVNLQVGNIMSTIGLVLFDKSVDLPIVGLQFVKYIEEMKSKINNKVIDVKSKYEDYSRQYFKLNDLPIFDIGDLQTKIAKNDDYKYVYKIVLEQAIEERFMVHEIYMAQLNLSLNTLEQEYSVIQTQQRLGQKAIDVHLNKQMSQLSTNIKQMLPRVKMNPCFSSQLYSDQRQSILPQIAKVAFLQGFINKLRNKVSRVDLLSSGFGFVINAMDLEDCVNYLNKSLYQFSEKEMRKKLDTCHYLFEMYKGKISTQEKQIQGLKLQISQMEKNSKLNIDALVHEKGNNLIYELGMLNRKAKDFQRFTVGLEDRIREELTSEIQTERIKLQTDQTILRNQFSEFKKLMTIVFKDEINQASIHLSKRIKQNYANIFRKSPLFQQLMQKTQEEGGMPKLSLFDEESPIKFSDEEDMSPQGKKSAYIDSPPGSSQQKNNQQVQNQKSQQVPNPLPVDPEQDLMLDPYQFNMSMNKLRAFYVLKMGLQKEQYEQKNNELHTELQSYQDIQEEMLQVKRQEEILKKELVNAHNLLKEQEKQNRKLQHQLEAVTFEKLKIEKIKQDLFKKTKNLEEQMKQSGKDKGLFTSDESFNNRYQEDSLKRIQVNLDKTMQDQLALIKKSSNLKMKQLKDKLKTEQDLKNLFAKKFESRQLPFIQFSATQSEASWKEKQFRMLKQKYLFFRCQELFNKNIELQEDLEYLKQLSLDVFQEIQQQDQPQQTQKMIDLYQQYVDFINHDQQQNQGQSRGSHTIINPQTVSTAKGRNRTEFTGVSYNPGQDSYIKSSLNKSEHPLSYGEVDRELVIKSRGSKGGGFRNINSRGSNKRNKSTDKTLNSRNSDALNKSYY